MLHTWLYSQCRGTLLSCGQAGTTEFPKCERFRIAQSRKISPGKNSSGMEDEEYITEEMLIDVKDNYTLRLIADLISQRMIRRNKQLRSSKTKQLYLCSFFYELLACVQLNPKIIKWMPDKSRYAFKLIEPKVVATIWGYVKRNPGMDYQKMSRAIRFGKQSGIFKNKKQNTDYIDYSKYVQFNKRKKVGIEDFFIIEFGEKSKLIIGLAD
ncbi:MAG: AAA ATPase Elf1 [Marteilia pararefringens]